MWITFQLDLIIGPKARNPVNGLSHISSKKATKIETGNKRVNWENRQPI